MKNNWRSTTPGMADSVDWRTGVKPESRQLIVNFIFENLKRHARPDRGHEELKVLAASFEESTFTSAASQLDYAGKITLKMQMMAMSTKKAAAMPHVIGQTSGLQNIQNMVAADDRRNSPVLRNTMPQSPSFSNQRQMLGTREQLASQQQGNIQQPPQQQQLMSQQLGFPQQPNLLPRDTQQRVQTPNAIDHRKQPFQSHRSVPEASSASLGSTARTGNSSGGDWQEEVYQMINTMKSKYLFALNQLHQRLGKLQQLCSVPEQPESQLQLQKVKASKTEVEKILTILQLPKSRILPGFKEKMGAYEKHIISILNFYRSQNLNPSDAVLQGQAPSQMHSKQQLQQTQPQTTEVQPQENHMNFRMQTTNLQSSVATMQQKSNTSLQHNSPSPLSGVSNAQQNMVSSIQFGCNLVPGMNSVTNSMPQVALGSLPQNPVSDSRQTNNMNKLSSQRGMNTLRPNSNMYSVTNSLPQIAVGSPPQNPVSGSEQANNMNQLSSQRGMNTLRPNSNIHSVTNSLLQIAVGSPPQNAVSGSQQSNNMNQLSSQRGMNTLRPNSNMHSVTNSMHQIAVGSPPQNPASCSQQANYMNQLSSQSGINTLRPNSNMLQHQLLRRQEHMFQKPQVKKQLQHPKMQEQHLQQQQQRKQQQTSQLPQLHQMTGDKEMRIRQQMGMKSGASQQYHSQGKCADDQVVQRASPRIEQQNLLRSLPKAGIPLQNATSPSVVPQVPVLQESGEVNSGIPSLPTARNIGHQQTSGKISPAQPLAISTPGISPSPLLAEITRPDGDHGNAAILVSGNSGAKEQPFEHLRRVVKSMSAKALSASVSEIHSVFSMVDRIPGSAPGYGYVGEDFLSMTNYVLQDGTGGTRKRKRFITAVPLNHMTGSEAPEMEPTATSSSKRPTNEANHALLEEIKRINQRLIDTVVEISTEDVDRTSAAAACEDCEWTVVKCSYTGVALSLNLKLQYASAQISPIQPLQLLVPTNYPTHSPILLDKFPVEVSKECEDLSVKAKSMFSRYLRILLPPLSVADIARTWDACAHNVISEYGKQRGGGSFSSKYGTWEKHQSAP